MSLQDNLMNRARGAQAALGFRLWYILMTGPVYLHSQLHSMTSSELWSKQTKLCLGPISCSVHSSGLFMLRCWEREQDGFSAAVSDAVSIILQPAETKQCRPHHQIKRWLNTCFPSYSCSTCLFLWGHIFADEHTQLDFKPSLYFCPCYVLRHHLG